MEEGRLGLDSIEKALLCNPRSTSVLLQKARVLEALGNLPEAISCFRRILELRPDSQVAEDGLRRLETLSGVSSRVAHLEGHTGAILSMVFLTKLEGSLPVLAPGPTSQAVETASKHAPLDLLATASADCDVRIWEPLQGRCLAKLTGHTDIVTLVIWSHAAQRLASASLDGTARLWAHVPWGPSTDAAGDWICASVLMPHEGRVTCLLFLPDKCTLASGSLDGKVRLWNIQTGRIKAALKGHAAHITSICAAANGCLASASGEGTVKIWDTKQCQLLSSVNADSGGVTVCLFTEYEAEGTMQTFLVVATHNPQRNEGRVLTWRIDGPTGWLDGNLQLNHKRFDGFRGALVKLSDFSGTPGA
ncbi:hypothetical protein WJX84_008066 [Apatococcus fuscideae]|uniref:Uncharacterized protein n=1 Tax=Apatococcus fuscideae TaxID=2026836 RepID=A0AAW1TDC7_9CHLO